MRLLPLGSNALCWTIRNQEFSSMTRIEGPLVDLVCLQLSQWATQKKPMKDQATPFYYEASSGWCTELGQIQIT